MKRSKMIKLIASAIAKNADFCVPQEKTWYEIAEVALNSMEKKRNDTTV